MAVIVRQKVKFGEQEMELPTYEPPGRITKEERIRADRLDDVLQKRIPEIAREVFKEIPTQEYSVQRWYLLGRQLRKILEDRNLVTTSDIDSGVIWPAIWQYLPPYMKPKGIIGVDAYINYRRRRKDYLSLGYEMSDFDWEDISWIERMEDWYQLASRPGVVRDSRILLLLGKRISALPKYPSLSQIREIAKVLGEAFPTRRFRDSSLLGAEQIANAVNKAVDSVVK